MSKQVTDPVAPGLGNTNNQPFSVKKPFNSSKSWCFTFNNYKSSNIQEILACLKKEDKYIIGEEVGESGTPHLQGYIKFNVKCRPLERIKIKAIHWEKCKGSQDQNITYCSKGGKFITNFPILRDPMTGIKPYKWQQEILDIVKSQPDSRSIYWFWDDGNTGKTTLCKHICMNYNAIMLSGKASDIKCGVTTHIERKDCLDIGIFHYTRTQEEYISYEALEAVKDGIFFNGKYESGMVIFNQPHVIVFANFEPILPKLTRDRWKVKKIIK